MKKQINKKNTILNLVVVGIILLVIAIIYFAWSPKNKDQNSSKNNYVNNTSTIKKSQSNNPIPKSQNKHNVLESQKNIPHRKFTLKELYSDEGYNNQNSNKKQVQITTNYYKVSISPLGAEIVSFQYNSPNKKYGVKEDVELAKKSNFEYQIYNNIQSYQRIKETPFQIKTYSNKDVFTVIAKAKFLAYTTPDNIPDGKVRSKTFPIFIEKKFVFYKDLNFWNFEWKLLNDNSVAIKIPYVVLIPAKSFVPKPKLKNKKQKQYENKRNQYSQFSFFYENNKFKKIQYSSGFGAMGCTSATNKDIIKKTEIDFFGYTSRFFTMSIQPLNKQSTQTIYYYQSSKELQLQMQPITLNPQDSKSFEFLIYTGPKSKNLINIPNDFTKDNPEANMIVNSNLYKSFGFGITAPIRDFIISLLQFIYKFFPNYGVSIILLSLFFKLVFFPLNQKQSTSMKKMQEIQPLLKNINEKYKDNPQEKQQKLMEIYRKHKVNPASGCLPMIIQIPIFIALYSAFSDSYELWQSPFIKGWINDLSEPDTIYSITGVPLINTFHLNILPILMSVTQFFQTKLTSVPSANEQQKILQFIPFIFLFFLWNFPSGVVLYWTFQNILSILQQLWVNNKQKKQTKKIVNN